jgi:uncharacterized membrane protein YjjP (DUF1212 family)
MMTGKIFDHFKTPPKVTRSMNLLLWALSMTIFSVLVLGFWSQELPVILTSVLMSVGRTGLSGKFIHISIASLIPCVLKSLECCTDLDFAVLLLGPSTTHQQISVLQSILTVE